MQNKKLKVWLPLLFAIVMILGMYFGDKLRGDMGGSNNFFKTSKRSTLQEALDLIRLKYVDSVRLDTLQSNAIQDMMGELDPHSVYIPATKLQEVNEDLGGKFEGIGVEFNIFSDTINVLYVIPDGPGDKAGLQIGDKILKADDTLLTRKNMTGDDVKRIIRGVQGSKTVLQILRDGKVFNSTVTRDMIPVSSVDASYMIDKQTGYIKLNKFSESTYIDFMKSLESLQKQGMQKLILDLRGNGGGFMNEAVDIADEFLDDDKLIVYTKGINSPRQEYKAKRPGLFETGKLTVLVDELTASASEVLAGALQDWDRGTIIGRRTFGKGLVQQQYQLSDGSAIRLTIARYYTPLGRSIQRPYDQGKKVYMDEIWKRYSDGEALHADSNKVSNGKEYKTPKGRIVYGGGGIMPDIFVPIDTSTFQRTAAKVLLDGTLYKFVYLYYLQHKSLVQQYANPEDFVKNFNHENEMWQQLVQYAAKDTVNLKSVPESDKESLEKRMKANLARFKWRNEGFYEVLNTDDAVIKKAIEVLEK
ncbi:MAG: S41 family peptidase [Bacteroidetes bacterium]|nr:S41 family peptidase [Bacteroidota bacterium]MBS1930361.1 S41 family peptidase [Bacteroidota bacterium]